MQRTYASPAHGLERLTNITYLKNVKVITGELQHNLVVVDIDKKQKRTTRWKPNGKKHNVAKLRDEPC